MEVNSVFVPTSAPVGAPNAPADSSRETAANLRASILRRLEQQTRLAPLPKLWAFLGATKSIRQLCGNPADLVVALQSEFSLEQLLAARIIERSPDNQLRLSPIFGAASAGFVIRRDGAQSPIDVVSALGLLSSPTPDWLRFAAEWIDGSKSCPQPVLLACNDHEVRLLHRLGLPFVPAADLEQLSGDQARTLFAAHAAHPPHRQLAKFHLTLIGWQIAACINQPAPKTLRTLEHVLQLKTVLKLDPAAVFDAWLPSDVEFRAICRARSFSDRAAVRRALLTSLAKSRFTPANARTVIRDRAEINYGAARRNVVRCIERSNIVPRCAEIRVALAQLRTAFKKSVLDKFDIATATESNPWAHLRSRMGEKLGEDWFQFLPEVHAAQNIIAGEHPANVDSDQLLEKRLRLVDRFAKLYALGMSR